MLSRFRERERERDERKLFPRSAWCVGGGGMKDDDERITKLHHPTNNALLISFRLSSDAEVLLVSSDRAWKSAPKMCHFAYHRWWLGTTPLLLSHLLLLLLLCISIINLEKKN